MSEFLIFLTVLARLRSEASRLCGQDADLASAHDLWASGYATDAQFDVMLAAGTATYDMAEDLHRRLSTYGVSVPGSVRPMVRVAEFILAQSA